MNAITPLRGLSLLDSIGKALRHDVYPSVHRGGVVSLGTGLPRPNEPSSADGLEVSTSGAREGEGGASGSRGGSREGAGEGQPREGSRSAASASSVFGASGIGAEAAGDLGGALVEYPQLKARVAPPGLWVSGVIAPIPGLPDQAFLMMSYPSDRDLPVKAWAWWDSGIWIGPRHTNYGEGSVCAFEQGDQTWTRADPLLNLLDLTVGWIVRHLHNRYFGCWPGRQRLHTVLERLREQRPSEFCGCDSGRPYEACHRRSDLAVPPLQAVREFRALFPNPTRRPPLNFGEMQELALTPMRRRGSGG